MTERKADPLANEPGPRHERNKARRAKSPGHIRGKLIKNFARLQHLYLRLLLLHPSDIAT